MRRFVDAALLSFSTAALALPFHSGPFWPLAFVGFVPYFLVLEGKTAGQALRYSFVFGVLFFAALIYPVALVTYAGLAALVLYLALYPALFGYFAAALLSPETRPTQIRSLFFVSAAWTALEYLRGILFGGFPFELLAYSQWQNLPAIQISDITGAYGVSFFIVFVNVGLYRVLRELRPRRETPPQELRFRRKKIRGLGVALGIAAGIVFLYGFGTLAAREGAYKKELSPRQFRVSVLQGNIPQEEKWDNRIKNIIFEKYKRLTFMGAVERSDLIVWPETSFPGYLEDEPVMAVQLRSMVRQSRTHVLVGAPTMGDLESVGLRFFNSAILYRPDGEEAGRYNKLHLVPFGEYIPLEALLGIVRKFVHIGRFSAGRDYTLFEMKSQYQKVNQTARFAVLICFEDIFPGLVRDFGQAGADFFVNITNDAWFGDTSAPYQHAHASIFRAVENRKPVVRAANTGLSCFITPEGRVAASVNENGRETWVTGHKSHDIRIGKERSFYSRFGDVFVFLAFLLCFLAYRQKDASRGYYRA